MKHFGMGPNVLIALVLLSSGCGDNDADSGKTPKENDTDTENSGETDEDSEKHTGEDDSEGTDSQDSTSPEETDDNTPPDLQEHCTLVTKHIAGEEVGRFEVSGEGDGREPDIIYDPESDSSIIVWGYLNPAGDDEDDRRWGIQSAALFTEVSEEDDSVTSSLSDTTIVTTPEESHLAESPAIAPGDSGFAIVFRDARYYPECNPLIYEECKRDLSFMKLDASGAPLDAEPTRLTTSGLVDNRAAIAATPDGGHIVAWTEFASGEYQVNAIRIDADGTPGEPFLLDDSADNYTGPTVASNNDISVIVFTEKDKKSIMAALWPHDDSEPSDSNIVVSDAHTNQHSPQIEVGNDGFLVAWSGSIAQSEEVFLIPLDAAGEVNGDAQRATWSETPISGPEVAWNGETFAIVWQSVKDNGSPDCAVGDWCHKQVFGALADRDGEVTSASVLLSNDPNQSQSAKIVWDGIGWTVVWQAWRKNRWQVLYGQMLCD